jgi:hypothetical protein
MPGRTRRTVTEDQIEEAAAPTRGTQDSVADASDDERRPGPSRRAQRKDAGADGAESDAEEIIDVRGGLANAALARADAKNVGALSADWAQLAQLARTAAGDAMPEIGAALADVQGEAAAKALDELDGMMREMVDLDAAMRVHKDVLDGLFQAATRGDDVVRASSCLPLWASLTACCTDGCERALARGEPRAARGVRRADRAAEVRGQHRVQGVPRACVCVCPDPGAATVPVLTARVGDTERRRKHAALEGPHPTRCFWFSHRLADVH